MKRHSSPSLTLGRDTRAAFDQMTRADINATHIPSGKSTPGQDRTGDLQRVGLTS